MQRGCIRNLEGHLKRFCLNQSTTCKSCFGNDCNRMTEFRSCYVNSNDLSTELVKLSQIYTKICRKFDDKCFSFVTEENAIIKDCLTDYTEHNCDSIELITKSNNSSHYKECSGTLCNFEEIEPLWCVGCDSRDDPNCLNAEMATRIKCPLEVMSSGCYHHIDGEHVKRGCMADLDKKERKLCESDSDRCKKCFGRECNSRQSFQKCITTNQDENATDHKSKICRRYGDECFIHVSNEIIRKGCMSDIIETPPIVDGIDAADCENDEICVKCSLEDDCNSREIAHERCVVCSSENQKNCANFPVDMIQKCPLVVKEMGCYLKIGDNTERGCLSRLNFEQREDCREGNANCKVCYGNGCNEKPTFQECYVCNSKTDGVVNCWSSPWLFDQKRCPNYLDSCYTQAKDGVVIRNCTGDELIPNAEKCEKNSKHCMHCDNKGGCNDNVITQETCISCKSADDPTCATNSTFETLENCPLSVQAQQCFHSINENNGEHIRGNLCVYLRRKFVTESYNFTRLSEFAAETVDGTL